MNLIFFIVISALSIAPFIPNNSIIGSLTIGDILFLIISPIIIIRHNYKIIFTKINICIVFIGIISLLSSINSYLNLQITDLSFSNILYSFKWFYFALLASLTTSISINAKLQKIILNSIIFGCLLTLIITILLWLKYPVFSPLANIPMLHIVYEDGFKINRNYLGFVLSIGASISHGMIYVKSKLASKIYYSLITLIFFVGLTLTFSKGAWICILALLIISIFRDFKKYKTYLISLTIFISTIISVNRLSIFQDIVRRLNYSDSYNEIRFQMFKDSINLTFLHPILGVGPQAYKSASINQGFLPTVDPHNSFSWISSELGLFAFFLVCFIFFQSLKNIHTLKKLKTEKLTPPLINLFTVFLIHSFLSGLTLSSRYIWIIIGLTQGIIIYQKRLFSKKTKFIANE